MKLNYTTLFTCRNKYPIWVRLLDTEELRTVKPIEKNKGFVKTAESCLYVTVSFSE